MECFFSSHFPPETARNAASSLVESPATSTRQPQPTVDRDMSNTCAVDTRFQTPPKIVFELTCISAPMRLKSSGWKTIHILARLSATGLSSSQPWRRHPTPAVKAITRMARAPAPWEKYQIPV